MQGQAAGARDGLGRTCCCLGPTEEPGAVLAALIPGAAGQLLPGDTAGPARRWPSPGSRCLQQQQVCRGCKLKDNSLLLNLIFICDDCLHLCCQAEGHQQPLSNLVLA